MFNEQKLNTFYTFFCSNQRFSINWFCQVKRKQSKIGYTICSAHQCMCKWLWLCFCITCTLSKRQMCLTFTPFDQCKDVLNIFICQWNAFNANNTLYMVVFLSCWWYLNNIQCCEHSCVDIRNSCNSFFVPVFLSFSFTFIFVGIFLSFSICCDFIYARTKFLSITSYLAIFLWRNIIKTNNISFCFDFLCDGVYKVSSVFGIVTDNNRQH